MTVQSLLEQLRARDIWVWADGDQLRCSAPAGVTQSEIGDLLRQRKDEIFEFLRGPAELSFAQQRLWFLKQFDPRDTAYIMASAVELAGTLDVQVLERAIATLVRRHESLRTVFGDAHGQARQRVVDPGPWALPVTDLSAEPDVDKRLQVRLGEETTSAFDLARGPLFRARLYRLTERRHVLLLTMHHIVSDGWSISVLFRELSELYRSLSRGEAPKLPPLRIQYRDFARWQRGWLKDEVLKRELEYWRNRLAGMPQVLALPTDRPRPAVESHRGASHAFALPRALVERLHRLSQNEGATLFMTLAAGFALLLARYSGQQQLLIGTPVANRNRAEIEPLVGFFVNTLVLRADVSDEPTVRRFVARMREECLDAYAHQDLPFERLVEELRPARDLSRNAVFQVMFALQNAPDAELALPGLTLKQVELEAKAAQFDVSLLTWETAGGLRAYWTYATDLFDEPTIVRMAGHWQQLLEAMADAPERRITELSPLTEIERHRVLRAWNSTRRDYGPQQRLHQLIEAQAGRTPEAVALEYDGRELTYEALNRRANRLARILHGKGVGPDALVGVLADRSLEMVVALLAILKAGGAYVPLDPEYPRERLGHMLEDARVALVLAPDVLSCALPATGAEVLSLDAAWTGDDDAAVDNPVDTGTPQDLAYVIFTSGSTGRPKGAMNEHRGICNRLLWMQEQYALASSDRVLQKTPFSFDVSVWEFFWPLMTGARLVIARPGGHRDSAYLVRLIRERDITTLHFVPSMLRAFLDEAGVEGCRSLKRVICSGEALTGDLQTRFFERLPNAELHNLYGPTEAAVDVTYWACRRNDARLSVPIGRPVANTQMYVLDARGGPVPVGVAGELNIGGVQVGRGYVGRPDLTAERFVPDPFSTMPGARLYKTGDLARWLPDGVLEYLGRADHQVKIRGQRIELGEIEAVLQQHPAVSQGAVMVREDVPGDQRLVAYVVGRGELPAAAILREHVARSLPQYMVPAVFVVLPGLPMTASGKLDRKALPAPEQSGSGASYVAPDTATEEILAGIWAEVLGRERVSRHDNFFDLGGHSLLATRIVSRVRQAFEMELPLRELFSAPELAGLAVRIDTLRREAPSISAAPSLESVPLAGPAPLSFAQQRLWVLDRIAQVDSAYKIQGSIELHGILDVALLERALGALVDRHEALRTVIVEEGGVPLQRVSASGDWRLPVTDVGDEPDPRSRVQVLLREAAARDFDLARGPLFRADLYRLAADEHVLLLAMHHVVSDGWSLTIMMRELGEFYRAFSRGEAPELPRLRVQYRDFARWQREWMQGEVLSRELEHWRERLSGAPLVLDLPTDRPRPAVESHRGAVCLVNLPRELVERLRALSRRAGATLFMTLLSGFALLLARYSGQRDILIGSPVANRNRAELEPLVGFFTNTLVLRADLGDEPSVLEFIARLREACLDAYAHQDLPFERLVEELRPVRDLSRNPVIQVAFALQNAPGQALDLPGLRLLAAPAEVDAAQFDLSLLVWETAEGLAGGLSYATDLFDASTIARLVSHWRLVLEVIVAAPDARVLELPLLSEAERARAVVEWNRTQRAYPEHACVHELFAERARVRPDAVAVEYGGERLSYGELDARADCVAGYLQAAGAGRDALVGVYLERSVALVVCLLGILKAGGAYVPLDPSYPAERLSYMLEDTRAAVVLTRDGLRGGLPGTVAPVVCVDRQWEEIARHGGAAQGGGAGARSLAYVIYTSGSTGRPKGVAVTHRSINRLVCNTDYVSIGPEDRVAQASVVSFDAATFEIWGALLNGARVVGVAREEMLAAREFGEVLRERGITVLFLTTALFNQVAREAPGALGSLRCVLFGGEAVDVEAVRAVLRAGAPRELLHVYGPTEVTTFSTWQRVEAVEEGARTVPIGRPIANTTAYVLDEHGQPVPVGVAGELYLGGPGVARGYLGQEGLTAEKFVVDPFERGGRLYRTGDWVRYREDGALEFVGRRDAQVKVRGYRIELGEIESALTRLEAVREAVAVVRTQDGERRVVAYAVCEAGRELPGAALREELKRRLPEYMLPAVIVVLERLPLTPNGKVDRDALPAPAPAAPHDVAAAPRSELEQRIAAVWCEVLKVERVGVRENFFDLGGHSLLLVRLHARLREALRRELSIVELFEYPTVEALAAHLGENTGIPREFGEIHDRIDRRRKRSGAYQPIAIVGMAGRFPGARDPETLWRNVCAGMEAVTAFTDEELRAAGVSESAFARPEFVRTGTVLEDVDLFDAAFFGYTPREAQLLDPQQRQFLECAWEALESAGCDPARYAGAIGVFAGVAQNTYLNLLAADPALSQYLGRVEGTLAADKDFVATRVSYKLGLKGPSLTVQTACSTSLVAVHVAARSLQEYECDMALAGGVSITVPQKTGYLYEPGGIQSPDGHCRAFDANAGGTIGGSGAGLVVLKRLEDALAEGDTIHAVVIGSAVNNDGAGKVGFTAPSVEGQATVIAAAHAEAGVSAETIGYVEAHGTGTRLGDPVEVAALTQVFRASTRKTGYCGLGSIKTNIGHLNTAAGCAGLIKAALAVRDGMLPPSLHYRQANPEIDFASTPFFVNTTLAPWPADRGPRRAGVSSFGIGGTNAHVVIEEAPTRDPSGPAHGWQLLVLSARTETALDAGINRLAEQLESHPDENLADIAYTLQVGRHEFDWRAVALCRATVEAPAVLRGRAVQRLQRRRAAGVGCPVTFMFTGQGAQYPGMGAGLYQHDALYRKVIDECCGILARRAGMDLRSVLLAGDDQDAEAGNRLRDTRHAQPALFVTEYALAQRWMAWGIRPDAMIGHSIGEYVAACLAGVMSLEDALMVVAARGRLIGALEGGAMLAVPLPEDETRGLLGDALSIAAINAPELCIVAGANSAIDRLRHALSQRGIEPIRLHTSHAFHSSMMDPALTEFGRCMAQVRLSAPRLPYVSNLSGTWVTSSQAVDPQYWVDHMRRTVRFSDGIRTLLEDQSRILLEVGPGHTLAGIARQHLAPAAPARVFSSLRAARDGGDDEAQLLGALGGMWLAGASVDWRSLSDAGRRRRVPLPNYAFDRQRYWVNARRGDRPAIDGHRKADVADWFYTPAWVRSALTPRTAGAGDERGAYLLFVDRRGAGNELARLLRDRGDAVVEVRAGHQYAVVHAAHSYVVDPASPADYVALLADLRSAGSPPRQVIHLWSVEARCEESPADRQRCHELGFYSLMFLAQAIGLDGDPARIAVVSEGVHAVNGAEPLCPEKALVMGACRVIPDEYPRLSCRNLDVLIPEADLRSIAAVILREVDSASAETVVAYRYGERWSEVFLPTRLPVRDGAPAVLRSQGVYLITGGLGGIGLAIAGYLARSVHAKLVLVGRSDLPPPDAWDKRLADQAGDDETSRRIRALRRMEADGAEVLVVAADVADERQLSVAVARAVDRFGRIHGVVHAAGSGAGGIIQLKSRADAAAVLSPKVDGTRMLQRVLAEQNIDFLVLCSSLTSVLGGPGRFEYCAANAFLDAYPAYLRQRGGPLAIAIDWDTWGDVGMAAQTTLPGTLAAHHEQALRLGIAASEGVEVFRRVLAAEPALPRLLVSTRILDSRLAGSRTAPEAPIAAEPRQETGDADRKNGRPPHLSRPYCAPRDTTDAMVAGIWQELMGIDVIGIDDDFFELGGHSLLAIQLIGRANGALGVKLTLQDLFAAPTVAALSARIETLRARREPEYDRLTDLVENLDRYSEEDIRRIVSESRAGRAEVQDAG